MNDPMLVDLFSFWRRDERQREYAMKAAQKIQKKKYRRFGLHQKDGDDVLFEL